MDLQKIVTSKTKIRFQDCDPFNHLNNASYINYFMNHREDQLLLHYDVDIYKMAQKKGVSWVSNSNQIAYIKPAFLMETVTIESQLIAYDNSNLKVEMRMYDATKSQLKAILWCGFTHFNLIKQQRTIHDETFMELFEAILNPVAELRFEERIQNFRKNFTELMQKSKPC